MLLATYNGEDFLPEFLMSLQNQKGVEINLIVSDDGSHDKTIQILRAHKNNFRSFSMHAGPRQGPAENFFYLLTHAHSRFVAFADQDDIWLPDHLQKAHKRLSVESSVPSLTFSRTLDFNQTNKVSRLWPIGIQRLSFQTIMTENLARGCTICFNRAALLELRKHSHNLAVMHDWWALLLIALTGKISFGLEPEVIYRIHQNNVVGIPKRHHLHSLKSMWEGSWRPYLQLSEIRNSLSNEDVNENYQTLSKFLNSLQGSWFKRFRSITLSKTRFRTKLTDELSFRLGVIFFQAKC